MSAGFTRGPWEYRRFSTEQGVVFDISTESGGVDVAYTYSREANARLISAAPELLNVLLDILQDHATCEVSTQQRAKALAVIAKATGSTT